MTMLKVLFSQSNAWSRWSRPSAHFVAPRAMGCWYSSSSSLSSQTTTTTTTTPSIPDEANPEKFPPPKFWIPRDQRQGRSVFVADNTMWFGQSRLKRNDRRCPSRDLNFTALDCT